MTKVTGSTSNEAASVPVPLNVKLCEPADTPSASVISSGAPMVSSASASSSTYLTAVSPSTNSGASFRRVVDDGGPSVRMSPC